VSVCVLPLRSVIVTSWPLLLKVYYPWSAVVSSIVPPDATSVPTTPAWGVKTPPL
jgi:hypothetical protein